MFLSLILLTYFAEWPTVFKLELKCDVYYYILPPLYRSVCDAVCCCSIDLNITLKHADSTCMYIKVNMYMYNVPRLPMSCHSAAIYFKLAAYFWFVCLLKYIPVQANIAGDICMETWYHLIIR